MMEKQIQNKPRILCLHGFRTSGQILKKQVLRWPESVKQKLDLVFLDGKFPAQGKSDVEGIFDPPYYEWFQANQDFTEYKNFDECLVYIENYMLKNGPFDGVLGFSQGAFLAAAMPGMQAQGVAFQKINKIKFLILISGGMFGGMNILVQKAFVDPVVIHHPKGHTIPRLDEKSLATMLGFIDTIQGILSDGDRKN
ncbi:hypothetical protein TSUD_238070 [Trifolium subterraneum]|uniref:Serine hydrolase domain-containing protein n=1 Tax=Trifolium subterraneum TaxID=3900 RepID=A0A2Z6NK98_TRISU|nr:hypothetical protein TSUD_238070 [Trifolium subterraneum]